MIIILVTETKLNTRHVINFNNYHCILSDRNISSNPGCHGGGTSVLIKKHFTFEEINIQNCESIENTSIRISLENGQSLYVSSVYRSDLLARTINVNDLNSSIFSI